MLALWSGTSIPAAERAIPHPLPSHPGNIFLTSETIAVPVAKATGSWRLVDYDGKAVANGSISGGQASLGKLPVGCYELSCGEGKDARRVCLGVLEPLHARTPLTSPISIDVAMGWFFPKERMAEPASLCALAGINRVRDRYSWPELEPKRGEFASATRYEASAQIQTDAGLQVLQVGHASPAWANPNHKRFPLDLRDTYNFHRELARRWRGQVGAFEPWNEADIDVFGGHTGSEMASFQKAAYLGLKAGNPEAIACLNVFAVHRAATLRDFAANEAWPYFDTFNLHHYEALKDYPRLYADFREVSAGKPLWVSECSIHVKWSGDEQAKDLSPEDSRLQGERLTKTFALALHEGAEAVFYFMLPHYTEGQSQFGLLRSDLTPRPGFLALAAAGRLLADARPLGRLSLSDTAIQAYAFQAQPDGQTATVVVAWAERESTLELPAAPSVAFDHLGRARPAQNRLLAVGPAPVYGVLPKAVHPTLLPPPARPKLLPGEPGLVVLQALLPEQEVVLAQSAYKMDRKAAKTVPIFVYNFGKQKFQGHLAISGPAGWTMSFPTTTEIAPGERKELPLELTCGSETSESIGGIRITGDFGGGGRPVLALRFVPDTAAKTPAR